VTRRTPPEVAGSVAQHKLTTSKLLALLLIASSVTAFDYTVFSVDRNMREARRQSYLELLEGRAKSPYRYRILVPALTAAVLKVGERVMNPEAAFHRVNGLISAAAIVLLLFVLHRYLTTWFTDEQALVGVLLTACTLPITLRQHLYAPYSLLEPTLFTLALMAIFHGSLLGVFLTTVVASLNRETGILVPIAFLWSLIHCRPVSSRHALSGVVCLASSIGIFYGLRWYLGPADAAVTVGDVWSINSSFEGLTSAATNVALFAGVAGWVLAIIGFRNTPPFVRRMSCVALLYGAMYLVWGIWYEVRLLMPLYPFLVPAMLSALYAPRP